MEFTVSSIEAASLALYHGNSQEQQDANLFIYNWTNSQGAEMLAFEILQDPNTSVHAKNASCPVIKNFVLRRFYINLDQETRNQFRDSTLESLAANIDNQIIARILMSTIVLISLYEWPENWPSFPFEVYPGNDEDVESKMKFFIELLNDLINQILNSKLVEPNRRIFLISQVLSIIPDIFSLTIPALGPDVDSEIFKQAMDLFINLLSISPIESFQNDEILDSIISAFPLDESGSNETYHEEWLKFADKLLLKHPGRKTLIEHFSKPILDAACQIENHSTHLSHFIVRYLTKYSDDLILLGIRENNETGSGEFIQLLAKQYLMTLESPLLNNSEIYDIWYLWLQLFRSDKIDLPNEDPNAEPVEIDSPLFELITFDDIIGPIFEMLVLSSIDGFIPQKVISKCMGAFYNIYGARINEILINSDPIPQTLIASSLLWRSMEDETEVEIASNLYSKILTDKAIENFPPQAIFAMSYCTRFLTQDESAQNSLCEILCALSKQSEYIESVSHALNFLADHFTDIFVFNDAMLLGSLLNDMDEILSFNKNGLRIFKSVCVVSMELTEEDKRNEVFTLLSTSVLENLDDEKKLLAGLHCLTVQKDGSPLFQYVIQKLLSLCPLIFDEDFPVPDIVNSFFVALSKAFISLPFDSIKDVFLEMLENLFQKPTLACQTFYLIEIVRKHYVEVEELLPYLLENLILPYLESKIENESDVKSILDPEDQIPNENFISLDNEFFPMLAEFSTEVFNSQQIFEAFLFGIRDMRPDVVKSSTGALNKLIDKIDSPKGMTAFMQTFRRDLLRSLFIALFDMLHSTSFSAHSKFLSFIFEKSCKISFDMGFQSSEEGEDMSLFEQEFCEEIAGVLNLDLSDQSNIQMLSELFHNLRLNYLIKKNFKEIIKEFLINTNRTTNAGIMRIEEQSENDKSRSLFVFEKVFAGEEALKVSDYMFYDNGKNL